VNNQNNLLGALRDINQSIKRAASLRVGTAKAEMVSACREAVKDNRLLSLFDIMEAC
jgi:Bardet-Biedl syndrome 2 protein